jgi:transposase
MKYITKKQLSEKLEPINLKALIAQETNGRMRIRLLALLHIKDGADRTQAAKHVKVSRKVVNDWAKKFFNEGLEGLNEKTRSGRRSKLTEDQLSELKEYVQRHSIKESGGRLNAAALVSVIDDKFGVKYSRTNVYRLLHALNFSWITSRSRHPKQSQEIQEDFKKIQNDIDRKDPRRSAIG